MADETLLLLAKDVRNKTLKLLEGVDDQQARFAAPHLTNTVLWHAGHAIMVNEHLGVSPATGTPRSSMMTDSPWRTWSIRALNRFLASVTLARFISSYYSLI